MRDKRWPRLTEQQLAVMAAIRDGEVFRKFEHLKFRPWMRPVAVWYAHGFKVTGQMRSLQQRRLIAWKGVGEPMLRPEAQAELDKHPEF